MKRLTILFIFILSLTSFQRGQTQPVFKSSEIPIKIGAIYEFIGSFNIYSESSMRGLKLAVEEINGKGGLLGRKLECTFRDSEARPDIAQREVRDLILKERVNFLMGPCSNSIGLAIQPVHSDYKILRISGSANAEAQTIDRFTPFIFQILPNSYMETIAATRYLHKKVPTAKKFCTIAPDNEFGRHEEATFEEEIKRLLPDSKIIYQARPTPGQKDYKPLINALITKKPDAIYCSLFSEDLVNFTMQALRSADPWLSTGGAPTFFEQIPFIAPYDLPALLALGPMAPEGAMGFGKGCFFMDFNPKMVEFVAKYRKDRGTYPDSCTIQAYDTVYLIKAAVERANTTSTEAVVKAMEGISFDSLRGRFTIRTLDHMGIVPCYQGVITKESPYPFKIWKDISRIPGEQVIRSEASVKKIWSKMGLVR